jgi:hypothetical protein
MELLQQDPPEPQRQRCQEILAQENRALELLRDYEQQGLKILAPRNGQISASP